MPVRPTDDRVQYRGLFLSEFLPQGASHAQIGFNLIQEPEEAEPPVFRQSRDDERVFDVVFRR